MKFEAIAIRNFKSVRELHIEKMENASILIGKNSTGKTVILDAILAVCQMYEIRLQHFNKQENNIEIDVKLSIEEEDLHLLHKRGKVNQYKRWELWLADFNNKFPSFKDGCLTFSFIANKQGTYRYFDGFRKDNKYIPQILPKLYYIDHTRKLEEIQADILMTRSHEAALSELRANKCIFDSTKNCNECFQCIGIIEKKQPAQLSVFETEKLLEYKLMNLNVDNFMERLNYYFHKNSGLPYSLFYQFNFDVDTLFKMNVMMYQKQSDEIEWVQNMSEGMKSIYIFSLLQAYLETEEKLPCIILIEDPEMFLHPQLQKVASEILYKLSLKNQVIFSTYSPNMIFNFNTRQIKQVKLDKEGYTVLREQNDISRILDDLGYSANDLMNVSFVFIVEGKQDRNRLPLLLNKYYSEVYDEAGRLHRISIITTNSCTNIKTYANLKYINQLYLKDQFIMIRDGDGKDKKELQEQLCNYYKLRGAEETGNLPKVLPRNVLVLKYYSFENYFLDPAVMTQIGVLSNEEEFYDILFEKYQEYLYRLTSFKNLYEKTGLVIKSKQDIKEHMEFIKIYGRGHNLFDIFYGRYKEEKENEILKKYIDAAPRENFQDILDAIDRFIYFSNRKL
ncbi:OLD family endonuclease [Aminipila luticellarii]|uniref:OLD family endonuclease n=2 Tax=Aminipila luticellarii TaxID=2507160 RepID=A0A410PYP2_9FIRM|nr:AAA family ATPase [Aminipila luticellarii]QAT44092.1 OLD family endonuclease [Aminipila luticellarii]